MPFFGPPKIQPTEERVPEFLQEMLGNLSWSYWSRHRPCPMHCASWIRFWGEKEKKEGDEEVKEPSPEEWNLWTLETLIKGDFFLKGCVHFEPKYPSASLTSSINQLLSQTTSPPRNHEAKSAASFLFFCQDWTRLFQHLACSNAGISQDTWSVVIDMEDFWTPVDGVGSKLCALQKKFFQKWVMVPTRFAAKSIEWKCEGQGKRQFLYHWPCLEVSKWVRVTVQDAIWKIRAAGAYDGLDPSVQEGSQGALSIGLVGLGTSVVSGFVGILWWRWIPHTYIFLYLHRGDWKDAVLLSTVVRG